MTRAVLVLNPRSDLEFVAFAKEHMRDGVVTPADLEARLRERYPRVLVRERGLGGEVPTWYVYREGAWIQTDE